MTPGVNFYLTSTKIEGRLTTYNILIIIEKSRFVTSYLHVSAFYAMCVEYLSEFKQ